MPAQSLEDEKVNETQAYFKLMLSLSDSIPKGEAPTSLESFTALATEWSSRLEVIRRLSAEKHSLSMYVFLTSKANYKILCQVGTSAKEMTEVPTVLDTGAGTNYICEDELLEAARQLVKQESSFRAFDANGNALSLFEVSTGMLKVEFVVCKTVQVGLVLGTTYIDSNVRSIIAFKQEILLRDHFRAPIFREWPNRTKAIKLEKAVKSKVAGKMTRPPPKIWIAGTMKIPVTRKGG